MHVTQSPGTPVHVNFTKWDGREHWQSDGLLLGTDEYGVWVGFSADTEFYRPGRRVTAKRDHTLLFPRDEGWVGRLYDTGPEGLIRYYIDLSTVPAWAATDSGLTVSMIDLDLDVVERGGQAPYIDDEDEFLEHQVLFGYPDEVVAQVRKDADGLLADVKAARAPFREDVVRRWVEVLRDLS